MPKFREPYFYVSRKGIHPKNQSVIPWRIIDVIRRALKDDKLPRWMFPYDHRGYDNMTEEDSDFADFMDRAAMMQLQFGPWRKYKTGGRGQCAVYRLYNKKGEMFYIGSTGDLHQRFAAHRSNGKVWASAEWFECPTRRQAYLWEYYYQHVYNIGTR